MFNKSFDPTSGNYIPALTGVRAIAAYMVFLNHYNKFPDLTPFYVYKILRQFNIGVTIFFVLSGLLITLRYYIASEISSHWFRKYLKNRIARIYPMYFLLTIATFLFASLSGNYSVYRDETHKVLVILMNLFFLRGFFDSIKLTGVAQGWTLTVEECFYFSAPLIFLLIHKSKKFLWRLSLLFIGIGCLLVFIFSKLKFYGFYDNFGFMLTYTFNGRCVEFFLGIYLALRILNGNSNKTEYPLFTVFGMTIMIFSILIMVLMADVEGHIPRMVHTLGVFSNNLILPIGTIIFFYGIIIEKSHLATILGSPLMQLLGKSSYVFYLIHVGFIADFVYNLNENIISKLYSWVTSVNHSSQQSHINSVWVTIMFQFIAINIISIILFKAVENTLNKLIRRSSFLERGVKIKREKNLL